MYRYENNVFYRLPKINHFICAMNKALGSLRNQERRRIIGGKQGKLPKPNRMSSIRIRTYMNGHGTIVFLHLNIEAFM